MMSADDHRWPSEEMLSQISPDALADWNINKITWLCRGGLDGFRLHTGHGDKSFIVGYPDPGMWRPGDKGV